MRGRSYYSHDEMATAQAARVGRAGGVATVEWVSLPESSFTGGCDDGEWVVSWDVSDERLHEVVGVDAAQRMLRAARELAERGLGYGA